MAGVKQIPRYRFETMLPGQPETSLYTLHPTLGQLRQEALEAGCDMVEIRKLLEVLMFAQEAVAGLAGSLYVQISRVAPAAE